MITSDNSKYPRNEIKSELLSAKRLTGCEIRALEGQIQELTRKNFNYNTAYSYTMDGLSAFCTDNVATGRIGFQRSNNYYIIKLSPEEYESYCIGPYRAIEEIRNKFWTNFKELARNPKTLVMFTDEGTFQGEPIRILVKRKDDDDTNSHGGKISNLKNQRNTTAIDYIQIEFFRPLFKQVVEDNANWIQLPRYLQAILDYAHIYYPELFQFTYVSKYDPSRIIEITEATIRKYFLYVNNHTNGNGREMEIDAIDFWMSINPSRVDMSNKQKDEETGKLYIKPRMKGWNENRQAVQAMARLHNVLVKKDLLKGIKFTTCGCYYNTKTKKYILKVYREKPLINAPDFQEEALPPANNDNNTGLPDPDDIEF